ncbi:hypothetical protein XENOCAPTIV_018582, partial [Xenoophorus captivus]
LLETYFNKVRAGYIQGSDVEDVRFFLTRSGSAIKSAHVELSRLHRRYNLPSVSSQDVRRVLWRDATAAFPKDIALLGAYLGISEAKGGLSSRTNLSTEQVVGVACDISALAIQMEPATACSATGPQLHRADGLDGKLRLRRGGRRALDCAGVVHTGKGRGTHQARRTAELDRAGYCREQKARCRKRAYRPNLVCILPMGPPRSPPGLVTVAHFLHIAAIDSHSFSAKCAADAAVHHKVAPTQDMCDMARFQESSY